jgi:hypothetical protein
MKLPHSVCEVLRDHVVLESECIDRMYLNVYVPQLQRIGGVVWYLRGHLGQRSASTAGVAPKTEAFVADLLASASRAHLDLTRAVLTRFLDAVAAREADVQMSAQRSSRSRGIGLRAPTTPAAWTGDGTL